MAGCFLSLYLQAFVLPWTPIYQGDSSPIFLFESVRMARGEVIYRDFFELTLPGTQAFYAILTSVFGTRAWIPSFTWILLGLALAWVGVIISRHLIEGAARFLPSLLFLGLAFCTERDPTHHWFSTLAVLGALAVLLPSRSRPRLAAAGALCGMATLFTQSRGGLAWVALALFVLWEWRRTRRSLRALFSAQVWLAGSYALIVVPALVYLAVRAGVGRLIYCILVFPLKYYPLWYWNTPHVYLAEVPQLNSWLEWPAVGIWLFVYVLVPAIYLVILVRFARTKALGAGHPWDKLMLVNMVGLFLFLAIASSPSWLRMCTSALPALILLVWWTQSLPGALQRTFLCGFGAVGLILLAADPLIVQTDWNATLRTPAGEAAFLDASRYDKFLWARQHTSPGDYLFQSSDCDMYYLLGLRDPAQVAFVTATGYTRPDQVLEVIRGLREHHVRYVLWTLWLDVPKHPTEASWKAQRLAPIRAYLRAHYRLVRNFGEPDYEQVWELKRPLRVPEEHPRPMQERNSGSKGAPGTEKQAH